MRWTRDRSAYVLGSDEPEIARLDAQASSIAAPTDTLLRAAGIGGDMRVLDLGTGLGHVAFLVAALLGTAARCSASTGSSGCSRSPSAGARPRATQRRVRAGRRADLHVRGAVRRDRRAADALPPARPRGGAAASARRAQAGRHDAARRVRHRRDARRSRTRRSSPRCASGSRRRSGPSARIRGSAHAPGSSSAARASRTCRPSGSCAYLGPRDPTGPILCAGIIRSLAPRILSEGIATEAELGLDTLQERVAEQVAARDATMLTPAVVGAWGRRP